MIGMLKRIAGSKVDVLVPVVCLLASASALAGAYISQYGFGFQPCNLCYYQRVPYWSIIGISVVALLLREKRALLLFFIFTCVIAFAVEGGIAFFHVGVEQKWWEGLDTCGGGDIPMTMEALRAKIADAPLARCDDPAFLFLGLTMAAWNVVYSAGLLLFSVCGFFAVKSYKAENKTDVEETTTV